MKRADGCHLPIKKSFPWGKLFYRLVSQQVQGAVHAVGADDLSCFSQLNGLHLFFGLGFLSSFFQQREPLPQQVLLLWQLQLPVLLFQQLRSLPPLLLFQHWLPQPLLLQQLLLLRQPSVRCDAP